MSEQSKRHEERASAVGRGHCGSGKELTSTTATRLAWPRQEEWTRSMALGLDTGKGNTGKEASSENKEKLQEAELESETESEIPEDASERIMRRRSDRGAGGHGGSVLGMHTRGLEQRVHTAHCGVRECNQKVARTPKSNPGRSSRGSLSSWESYQQFRRSSMGES